MKQLGPLVFGMALLCSTPGFAASLYLSGESGVPENPRFYKDIVSYYLPKTLLQVTLTYSIYSTRKDDGSNLFQAHLLQQPVLSLLRLPEPKLKFYVHLRHLNDWLTSTTLGSLKIGD